MSIEKTHRILLLNFTPAEAEVLAKAKFNVELGYLGRTIQTPAKTPYLKYQFPRPLYEYEVSVYNSAFNSDDLEKEFTSPRNLLEDKAMLEPFGEWRTRPSIRIAFLGQNQGVKTLVLAGLPFLELDDAHEGVSVFEEHIATHTFSLPELAKLISSFRKNVKLPVGQYSHWKKGDTYPYNHFPVILNRNGDQIATYGTRYGKKTLPVYIVLPQLKNNAAALLDLLEQLARLWPELFPDREIRDWYGSDAFAFGEEKRIDQVIEARVTETVGFIEAMRKEKAEVSAKYAFIKKVLIAREDPGLAPEDKLSANVQNVLEFLGFEVEDIDAKIRGVIRKEDFWVKEGSEFLAITEITGTNAKNPKIKEYNDLLGRMSTIFKRRDLVPDASKISGLLVVNYDIETHPAKRPRLYGGDAEEIVLAAAENSIGLLSTVELFKIAVDVKDGALMKEDARAMIKSFGRIEYNPEKPAQTSS